MRRQVDVLAQEGLRPVARPTAPPRQVLILTALIAANAVMGAASLDEAFGLTNSSGFIQLSEDQSGAHASAFDRLRSDQPRQVNGSSFCFIRAHERPAEPVGTGYLDEVGISDYPTGSSNARSKDGPYPLQKHGEVLALIHAVAPSRSHAVPSILVKHYGTWIGIDRRTSAGLARAEDGDVGARPALTRHQTPLLEHHDSPVMFAEQWVAVYPWQPANPSMTAATT